MASKNPISAKQLYDSAEKKIIEKISSEQLFLIGSASVAYKEGKQVMYESIMGALLDVAGCTTTEKQAYIEGFPKKLEAQLGQLETNKPKF